MLSKTPHYRKILQQSEGAQSLSPGSVAKGEQSRSDPRPNYKKRVKKKEVEGTSAYTFGKVTFRWVTMVSFRLSLRKVVLCIAAEVD